VFAAHPDDEVLGAGGLIHAAVAEGARVRVVIFTNGDGYLKGLGVGFRTLLSTPARFIQYGERRQQEARAAARRLGLSADQVTFLGYPDRGLATLWGPAWSCDHPYTSLYTRRSRSPYSLAYRPGVPYCGQNVLEDVESLLRREAPTIVVTHHPSDTHGDHWAAGAFVTAALEQLLRQDVEWAETVRVWSYLVHHGEWPQPRADAPGLYLVPPVDLETGEVAWNDYPIHQADQDAKRLAILEYRSQMAVNGGYMLSFARRNELFDEHPPLRAPRLEDPGLLVSASKVWDRLPAVIRGTPGSLLIHATAGSAKVDSVTLARDGVRLHVAVRLQHAPLREERYRLVARLFYRDGSTARLRLVFRAPQSLTVERSLPQDLSLPPGAAARSVGPRINIVLPLAGIGEPVSLLMHVETVGPLGTPVERSPWARVHLEPVADSDSAFAPTAPSTARGGTEFRRLPRSMDTVEVEFQRR
jgi:LmbE family N-acetylglucosaminyl deacetylase